MNSLLASNWQVHRYIAFRVKRYNAAKHTTFIPLFVPYKMSLTLDGDSLWTVHRCFVIEYQKPNHSGDACLMLPDVSGNHAMSSVQMMPGYLSFHQATRTTYPLRQQVLHWPTQLLKYLGWQLLCHGSICQMQTIVPGWNILDYAGLRSWSLPFVQAATQTSHYAQCRCDCFDTLVTDDRVSVKR